MNETFIDEIDVEKIKHIRNMWEGELVLKVIGNEEDAKKEIELWVG